MLANYTIKMTLDNGDSFGLGIVAGLFVGVAMAVLFYWSENR